MDGDRPISSYRDLDVWQDAMTLAESCYGFTKPFPREEMFGLSSQIRRAATSIAANIAEGHGRESTVSFVHFLRISQGSLKELETHLLLSGRVGLAEHDHVGVILKRCESVGRQLRALIRSLQRRVEIEKGSR
ncbi:four helix bundle protein [Methylobacterium sp. Leaf108]|nr:four helix bundle protein [Methylobacterium sp. Leaf108]